MTTSVHSTRENIAIGDVSKLCQIPAYTIRYWEKEFKDYFTPVRTIGKQRRYSEDHVRQILHIKKLLWHDRFSIQGARRMLKQSPGAPLPYGDVKIPLIDMHDLATFIAKSIGDFFSTSGTGPNSVNRQTIRYGDRSMPERSVIGQ
jgi:DNA-binding transcriptional MerR regulator